MKFEFEKYKIVLAHFLDKNEGQESSIKAINKFLTPDMILKLVKILPYGARTKRMALIVGVLLYQTGHGITLNTLTNACFEHHESLIDLVIEIKQLLNDKIDGLSTIDSFKSGIKARVNITIDDIYNHQGGFDFIFPEKFDFIDEDKLSDFTPSGFQYVRETIQGLKGDLKQLQTVKEKYNTLIPLADGIAYELKCCISSGFVEKGAYSVKEDVENYISLRGPRFMKD